MPFDPNKSQTLRALKGDLTPQSRDHGWRLFCGGFMGATGLLVILGKLFLLRSEFSVLDVVLIIVLIGGGAGIVFTGTVLALLDKAMLWRKS